MTPKTKKILIGSGIALLVTIGIIVGYKQYKKGRIDVTELTQDQRDYLKNKGVSIPVTGTVVIPPGVQQEKPTGKG